MDLLTRQFFTPLIGSAFVIALSEERAPVTMRLEAVTPHLPPQQEAGGAAVPITTGPFRQEPFSLSFRGPLDSLLAQGTYRLVPEMADTPLDIFIVPIGRDAQGFIYEAIFG